MSVLSGILIFISTLVLSLYLTKSKSRLLALDHPNRCSLHEHPIPRTGGVAILAGILLGAVANAGEIASLSSRTAVFLLAGLAPLALVSFQDDRVGVAAK